MIPRSNPSPGTLWPQYFLGRDAAVNNPSQNFHHHD